MISATRARIGAAALVALTAACSTGTTSDAPKPPPTPPVDGATARDAAAPAPADSGAPGEPDGATPTTVVPPRPGWTLTWHDEFDGNAVDLTHWSFDIGGTGWGNDEQQYYSDRPQNARLDGSGALLIKAFEEAYKGKNYSSARLTSKGHFEQMYGRFEARMKLPTGQGIWPAFWLVGANVTQSPWPACGEIDVMENIGREPSVNHGSLHGPGYSAGAAVSAAYTLPGGAKFIDAFHVFAAEWEPSVVRFYVDDVLYATQTPATIPAGTKWVYDHPFFLIVNLAVGGIYPKYPDSTTVFPQSLFVDYVRVYKR